MELKHTKGTWEIINIVEHESTIYNEKHKRICEVKSFGNAFYRLLKLQSKSKYQYPKAFRRSATTKVLPPEKIMSSGPATS